MIVDTSAVVAMAKGEDDAAKLSDALLTCEQPRMTAPTWVETNVVCLRQTVLSPDDVQDLLDSHGISTAAFTPEHARLAALAYRRFGKGSGHPAQLNLGDCFSYALAIAEDEALLFEGEDFTHTDVRNALAEAQRSDSA